MRLYLRVAIPTLLALTASASAFAQSSPAPAGAGTSQAPPPAVPAGMTSNPFPQPIAATEGVITVTLREFAALPDIDNVAARMMTLVEEPATRRLFVSDMRGGCSTSARTTSPRAARTRFAACCSEPPQAQSRDACSTSSRRRTAPRARPPQPARTCDSTPTRLDRFSC